MKDNDIPVYRQNKLKNATIKNNLRNIFVIYGCLFYVISIVFFILFGSFINSYAAKISSYERSLTYLEDNILSEVKAYMLDNEPVRGIITTFDSNVQYSKNAETIIEESRNNEVLSPNRFFAEYLYNYIYAKRYHKYLSTSYIYNICLMYAAYTLIIVFLAISIRRKIYLPVLKLKNAIHSTIIIDTNHDFSCNKKKSCFHSLLSELNLIIDEKKFLTLKESNAQIRKKQAEIKALQSQINPHFLYNTLDSIRGQAIVAGNKGISDMTLALAKLFRYSISDINEFVPLSKELESIDNYLSIQCIRFNNKFTKKYNIDDDVLICKIPKLTLQPIVENAIHHGLEQSQGNGNILIKAYRTASQLFIRISDNGVGISHEQLLKINDALINNKDYSYSKSSSSSVGLFNVNARIKLLFGENYGITIYSTLDIGTTINIVVPIMD